MNDYTIGIQVTIPVAARNKTEAEHKADRILTWISFNPPRRIKWAGDIDFGTPIIQQED